MVTCQEFKQWLIHQDSADENALRQVEDHIQACPTCESSRLGALRLDSVRTNR